MDAPSTRGPNITYLQLTLLEEMDGEDSTRLMTRIEQLMQELPNPSESFESKQGLLLGLVQSGKTVALTTAIAMAADNGYKCFIVLTSDNLWLYQQTLGRLKRYLPRVQIEGKQHWDGPLLLLANIDPSGPGLVLVTTKNASVLRSLISALENLRLSLGGELPPTLIVDDEADQASLDTKTSKRARDPSVAPGTINSLITQVRQKFARHVFLQVTATPQALFLQDSTNNSRPEFTTLIEPGKGYVGGNTLFAIDASVIHNLIRHISQIELDIMLRSKGTAIPTSLWEALCVFFVGASVKNLQYEHSRRKGDTPAKEQKYCFLCHISQKKTDHETAFNAIMNCHQQLVTGLSKKGTDAGSEVENSLNNAYLDIRTTQNRGSYLPPFEDVLEYLRNFVVGTEVQILNSDSEQDQPTYDRKYNVLVGGNKLSRGVTIPDLIVTYYGRTAKSPNMDTVLQHARMYGYRARDLDVTRVFLTPEVERRFSLINESEQVLRDIVESYPGKDYQGIQIGPGVRATRPNVLNPNNIGSYGAGKSYFPKKPLSIENEIRESTQWLDEQLAKLYTPESRDATQISIDQAIGLIRKTKSDPSGSGLWDTNKIVASLEKLKERYHNTAYLVVRKERKNKPNDKGEINAVLAGRNKSFPGDDSFAVTDYPTLFMLRQSGNVWNGYPFWIPNLRFPDGHYAIMFNFK